MSLPPAIRAAWGASQAPLEGRVAHPYLDTRKPPVITVGLGCALFISPAFHALPWLTEAGEPASPEAKSDAWSTLLALAASGRGGRPAETYAYPGHLHLTDEQIDGLAAERLDAAEAVLAAYWPAWETWPVQARVALLMLAWAVGPGAAGSGLTNAAEWPHLHAAVAREDWSDAAIDGQLSEKGNPGVRPRNLVVEALFILALGKVDGVARAGWPDSTAEERDAAKRAGESLGAFDWAGA